MKYAHSIFARRGVLFCLFFAGLCGLCMIRSALAIEKYAAVPLTDDGLGSTTRGLTKAGAGTLDVVGSKQKGDGTVGAMYWSIAVDPSDPSGNTVYATELPKPPGMSAWATGIAFMGGDPNRPIICGYTGTTAVNDGTLRAVIWRRNPSGQFVNTTFDDQAAVAHAIVTRNTPLGLIIVVCGKFQLSNGEWHACLWKISNQGTQRTDLGTLGGQFSEAMALLYVGGDNGVFRVVGNAQRSNGRTLAAYWFVARLMEEEGIFYFVKALQTPPGAESNAVYVGSATGGVWKTSGFIREPNGSTSASVWINQGEIPTGFVSQLYRDVLGHAGDTTANGIFDFNHDANDILVVGTAQNSTGRQRGVGALPFNQPFDSPFRLDALRAGDPALEWNAIALNAVEPGGAIAGEGLFSGSAAPQATLFLPTNIEVPQNYTIVIGPNIFDNIRNVWQEDGNALRFAPQRNGSVDRISIDFTSAGFSAPSCRAPRRLTLVSRIMPRNANATPSATLTLQLYDSSAGQWVNVATRIMASDEFFHSLVIEIPNAERFAVSGGGPLRWRIGLRGEEWRDFEVDLMAMAVEEMP